MADKKDIGVFWDVQNLRFVETLGTAPTQTFSIPYTPAQGGMAQSGGAFVPAEMQLISNIQSAFQERDIGISSIKLSLPPKDIIFRSFVIPWMHPNEIKGVVEFEASKYIPFALEELSFSYHSIQYTHDNTRRIRIIFVAIKKDTLETYSQIFEEANLFVERVEPAPLSIIRVLLFKQIITVEDTFALIEHGEQTGKIVIVDKAVPQFVREFQLRIPTTLEQKDTDPNALLTRLVNEIRVSLDYFNRQDNQIDVKRLVLLTSIDDPSLVNRLQEDLKIEMIPIQSRSILEIDNIQDVGFLNAYGVTLVNNIALPANIDLAKKKTKASLRSYSVSKKDINVKSVIFVALLCIPLITATYFYSGFGLKKFKQELVQLEQKLGESKDRATKKIKENSENIQAKLDSFQNINTKSEVAKFLVLIPTLLSDGTWINSMSIYYPELFTVQKTQEKTKEKAKDKKDEKTKDKKNTNELEKHGMEIKIDLDGYAYLENTKEQFQLVNTLLLNLKNNTYLAEIFSDITLEQVNYQSLGDFQVTYFKIKMR